MLGPIFMREVVTVPRRAGHYAGRTAVVGLLAILGITTWQATVGFSRDATKCNFDRPYRARTFTFTELDTCLADPACRAAFEAIDQRLPAGSMESCKSSDGVYDLNGNANEWVHLPKGKSPHRSGLKGGWWGPIRARCRPTVTFHDEGDFGYEAGFRCCSEAKP